MDKKLIPEIKKIIARYNSEKLIENCKDYHGQSFDFTNNFVKLENFEENINWKWVSKNYHISYNFIYEYQDKLNMKYLYDNFVITLTEFKKIKNREAITDRFEIMDI